MGTNAFRDYTQVVNYLLNTIIQKSSQMSKTSSNAMKDNGACIPSFIVVRHGENEKSILNADCRVDLLLDAVKDRCRIDRDADIDLVDEAGKLRVLSETPKKYVHEVLEDRAIFIPLAIDRLGADEDNKKIHSTSQSRDNASRVSNDICKLRDSVEK